MDPGLLDDRESDVIDLLQLWVALGRRKAVILATTALAVIAGLVITTVATPVYEAVTTLLVKDPRAAGERMFLDTGTSAVARNQVQNSVEMLRSRQVALRAAERLGYSLAPTDSAFADFHSSIFVQPVPNTETIRVIVRRPSPEEAAAIANAVAESFIELSRELNHGEVSAAREFIEEQLAVAEAQLQAAERALQEYRLQNGIVPPTEEIRAILTLIMELEKRYLEAERAREEARARGATAEANRYTTTLSTLRQQIQEAEARLASLPEKETTLAALTRERDVLEQVYLMLRERLEEVRIAEAMRTPEVAVIDPAVPPRAPVSPRPTLNLVLGTFLGLFLGIGIALGLEFLDSTIRSPDEAEALLGLPVLGRIPVIQSRANGG